MAPDVSNLDNSLSQSGSGSNTGPVIQSPAIPAPVVQSPAVPAPVVQGPAPALVIDTSTSSIDYGGTSEFIESAGMVIDCDFM